MELEQRRSLITPPASLRRVPTFMLRIPVTIPSVRSGNFHGRGYSLWRELQGLPGLRMGPGQKRFSIILSGMPRMLTTFMLRIPVTILRKIAIATGEVTTLAGTAGTSGAADGTGTTALFNNPADIASDGTNLYIADSGNHTIRKIIIAAIVEVTTLAGTAGTSGAVNGTGTAALFKKPSSIATDRTNLYIADSGNHTIRKMVIATGVVTTPAGKAGTSGSADGTGTEALFNNPVGVATVGAILYVGDTGNNTIRKIT